ncbi:glucuronide carrier protein [Oxobacter pfennigii]|uniref:Glucuronide carrier protein n=1 Tax=Oxobacter pfennigii TaxID=36849 RepID=A0A0P8YVA2_9CLOT|nr:MFS transporter [Oxobacter pfennigii]KPU43630.1 glucuronide carrier protein [Oxobacter pfennigii]
MNEAPKLTNLHINTYALSNSLNSMAFTVPMTFLTLFMTDYLRISPVAIGTGMLIAKTVDFLVGLIAGIFIEQSNMKKGKYLSWIRLLTITLFFGNIVQMIDTSSFISNATVRLAIVMIFYMMFHCSMNFYATSRAAMIPKMAGHNMEDRKKITARQGQFAAATAIITSAVTLPAVQLVQNITGSASLGYFIVAAVFSVAFATVNLIFVKIAAPFDPPQASVASVRKPPTVGQMVTSVVTNKQMLVLFFGFTAFTIGTQLYAGITAYYFRVTGTFAFMTVAMTARSICALLASLVAPALGRKIGKKGSLIFGWFIYALSTISIWAFGINSDGSANLVVMTVAMCLCQGAMYIYTVFTANYYLDCGEYGYYDTGIDNRTMALTVMNWPTKIGFALGGSLVGYCLAWSGYIAPTATTAATFTYMNRFTMSIGLIPGICMLIGATIILVAYKLTDTQAAEYAKLNAEREAGAAAKAAN